MLLLIYRLLIIYPRKNGNNINFDCMKTKYLFFGFTVLLITGCVNEEFKSTPSANGVRVFADMPSTRVSFTEGDAVTYATWQDGDVISLSTDAQNNLQYTAGVVGEGNGGTEFLPGGDALQNIYGKVVYACYPSAVIDMENMTVPLPNTENYNQPDFHPFVYAIDTLLSERLYLHFHHPYAYLKLTFTEGILPPDTISIGAVTITSDEVIAAASGTFNFSTQAVEVTGGSKTMLIERLGGDVSGHVLKGSPYTLYVPVLPQSEGTKITIKACYTVGTGIENCYPYYTMEKTVPAGGFQAGHIYTLTLGNDRKPGIYTAQDIVEIRASSPYDLAKWMDADSIINIMADIDMIGVNDWEGGSWSVPERVVFEGNNHKIFNIAMKIIGPTPYGFFGRRNYGIIRNLTLDGEITSTEDNAFGGAFCEINGGSIYNCHNYVNINATGKDACFSGFCFETDGPIQNCTNYGNIKASSACGIATPFDCNQDGYCGSIIDCRNYGTVEGSGNGERNIMSLGGISWGCYGTITGCFNEGRIIGVGDYVGGICGSITDAGSQIMDCQNTGEINCDASTTIGGIVGFIHANNILVSNCNNLGDILPMRSVSIGGICGTVDGVNIVLTGNTNTGTVNGVAGSDANAIGLDNRGQ